jgi:mono/diheme cytochrome c family protein
LIPLATSAGLVARYGTVAAVVCVLALAPGQFAGGEEPLSPRPTLDNVIGPFVEAYCIDCHAGDSAEAGLDFEKLLAQPSVPHRRLQWERAVRRMEAGEMPPADMTQPEPAELEAALQWLRAELADPDCTQPQNPGKPTLRRLNRTEYQNTVRDLTGVEFDAQAFFPRDELGYGFDNNGDVLSLPTLLLEKYLQAAEQISAQAIVTPESISEPVQSFAWGELHGGAAARGVRGLFSSGRIWAEAPLTKSGQYIARIKAFASQMGDEPTKMQISIGDKPVCIVNVPNESEDDPQTFVVRFKADEGISVIGVEMTNDAWNPQIEDPNRRDRNLYIVGIDVVGPTDALTRKKLPASHRQLLAGAPSEKQWRTEKGWIKPSGRVVKNLLDRGFRRPATTIEIERMIGLVAAARENGDSFERAMQLVLQATLVSPQLLFIGNEVAPDAVPVAGDEQPREASPEGAPIVRPLSDYELASQLSYFFWSTMPDSELLELAAAGKLRNEFDPQIDRLLNDPRADRLIRNFSEQWLETRRLESLQRSAQHFPDFDHELRDSFREETFRLVQDIVRNRRPLSTLLSADYSFINGRIARHYGMAEPTGDEFVRVELPKERQAGILTHGSVLAVTAFEDRTSPVLRGKWVLDHLLADPPPPPPPDAGSLPDATGDLSHMTLRERLELHRADPTCASCHKRMDPLGLAMENFDAVGRWRDKEGDHPIDASGELPDGRKLDGPASLRDVLLEDFGRVRRSMAERLLIFALGRGLEPYDTCAVNEVVAAAETNGDTFESMVRAVVKSAPFQQRSVIE